MKDWTLDNLFMPYVVSNGQYCISRLMNAKIDHALVNVFFELLCQETNTFYLSVSEAVVTLQDALLLWVCGLTIGP